jgi:drug/metabolite transporter (DMT)-like permease
MAAAVPAFRMDANRRHTAGRTFALTGLAMLAFAGNSILCRMALVDAAIDPASFTSLRLGSGAAMLLLVVALTHRRKVPQRHGSWLSALMLFGYAVCFSYAYVSLGAGAGALILFGFVQVTMIAFGLWSGDRPGGLEWLGWALAVAGLVWLVSPGVEAPPVDGAVLMATAGIAWGVYTLRGRGVSDPLAATASNFTQSLLFAAALAVTAIGSAELSGRGALLAVLSGAATSGIGYVIWYAALEELTAMQAALVQLSVPVIAAGGGVLLLSEPLTMRLLLCSALVLGGISLALGRKTARA